MLDAIADTHTVIWYLYGHASLSRKARAFIEETVQAGGTIGISGITLVEMVYLVEKGRLHKEALSRLIQHLDAGDSVFVDVPVDRDIAKILPSIPWEDVPDMPDRIIAATALYWDVPLITRDYRIRKTGIRIIW